MTTEPGYEVSRSMRRDIAIVLALAMLVRSIGAWLSIRYLPVVASDTIAWYLPLARSLATGHGFQIGGSALEASHIPPLYPLWLATLMRAAGTDPPIWVIAASNVLFRSIACVMVFLVAYRYFDRSAAIAATALYLIDPWESFWTGFVLKESLGIALFLIAIWLLVRAADSRRNGNFFLAGVGIGIATLGRFPSGALIIAALGVIWLATPASSWPSRFARVVPASVCVIFGMLMATSPWIIRNWRVVGEPVLSTHFVGRKLYTSNGPGIEQVRSGYYSPRGIDQQVLRDANPNGTTPLEQERSLARLTLQHILAHPGELPARLSSKLVNMWRPTFAGASVRNLLLLGAPYCVLILLSLFGLVIEASMWRSRLVLVSVLAVYVSLHILYWGEIRNRQYLMPLLYCYGGVAVVGALRAGTRQRTAAAPQHA